MRPQGARPGSRGLIIGLLGAALSIGGLGSPYTAIADSSPLGLTCAPYPGGTVTCSGEVNSFDGAPLDVDVTEPMPNTGDEHALMVMLHGFGNNKHEWESTTDLGDGADKSRWNSHWFAEHGYYVLTYTARGFKDLGPYASYQPATPSGIPPAVCGSTTGSDCPPLGGTIRVKSAFVEIRDTQWLAAQVASAFAGVDSNEVAVTGGSYGGGESWLQASQADWTFPNSMNSDLPVLHLQVAIPKYPWTDLTYSLFPNGHGGGASGNDLYASSQDQQSAPGNSVSGNPIGLLKASYIGGLTVEGLKGTREEGFSTTPGEPSDDREALSTWFGTAQAGEPYDVAPRTDTLIMHDIRDDFSTYHSAYYQNGWASEASAALSGTGREVAIFSISGWTDDLFPPVESFRMFKYLKSLDPRWPVAVGVADVGHSRAQNKPATWHRLNNQAFQFLQANIQGSHRQQTTVFSEPTICPTLADSDAADQITASTPEGLSHGLLTVDFSTSATLVPDGGINDPNGPATDAILAGSGCHAAVALTAAPYGGYTAYSTPLASRVNFVGIGYIQATYAQLSPGQTAAVAARVWDVAPDNTTQELVSRGVYRFDFNGYDTPSGTVQVPLYGNDWIFAPGHSIRLDLEQADYPTYRPPNAAVDSGIELSTPELVLPTREASEVTITGG